MKNITVAEMPKMTAPNPVTLVCTEMPDGGTNLATISWWTILSFNPPMIGICMSKASYSGERLKETGRIILTVPSEEIAQPAFLCGTVSGRDKKKAAEFGIGLQAFPNTNIKIPVHSKLAVACNLKEVVETGDHNLYICTAENVSADESKVAVFAWDGYARVEPLPRANH